MNADQLSLTPCPEHVQLLALAEGTLASEDTERLESHVASCEHCDARLASIEEQSDTLVRSLASLPVTDDDETTFRRLQADLLARPEPFGGNTATTEAFSSQIPLDLVLPLRLGNYELLEQIGAGAHGAVFRARHTRLEREVAIKLLLHAGGPAVDEFLNEMRVVGQLDHPNIIRATDAGEHGGTYFLVMDFVPGLDVSSLLREVDQISVADACEIARQTALGLEVAHNSALVHRDVKTSNLLFTNRAQIKLLDLGLATIAAGPTTGTPVASGPRGTSDYMAPEQWRSGAVTASADIYSLGCTLFKLLTGVPPFRSVPPGFTSKQAAHECAPVPRLGEWRDDVPPALEQLVNKMLAKEAPARPTSAEAVARQLKRYARGHSLPLLASRVFPEVAPIRPVPAKPISRRLLLTAGVVSAAAATTALWPSPEQPSLQREDWRPLAPANPPLIHVTDEATEFLQDDAIGKLSSQGPALLQLGRPIGKKFQWRMRLQRDDWRTGAGVFFSLRRTASEALELQFYTIELQAVSDQAAVLQWVEYRSLHRELQEPVVLAEAAADEAIVNAAGRYDFDVLVGRSGFPEIAVNDRRYPQTAWTCATEARPLITTNVDQLSIAYSGRIGVFHQGGVTKTLSAQLMYLEA